MLNRILAKAGKIAAITMPRKTRSIPHGKKMVSFSFDDIPGTAERNGARILQDRDARGTFYLSMGITGEPSPSGRIATLDEITSLIANGHECGCHTYHHVNCAGMDGHEIREECTRNREEFHRATENEFESFSYPFGGLDIRSRKTIADIYRGARTIQSGINTNRFDPFALRSVALYEHKGRAAAFRWLETLDRNDGWLIYHSHDVCGSPSRFGSSIDLLSDIVDACIEKDFEIVTISEGLRRCDPSA